MGRKQEQSNTGQLSEPLNHVINAPQGRNETLNRLPTLTAAARGEPLTPVSDHTSVWNPPAGPPRHCGHPGPARLGPGLPRWPRPVSLRPPHPDTSTPQPNTPLLPGPVPSGSDGAPQSESRSPYGGAAGQAPATSLCGPLWPLPRGLPGAHRHPLDHSPSWHPPGRSCIGTPGFSQVLAGMSRPSHSI